MRAPLVTTVHDPGWLSVPTWMPEWVWRALERRGRFDRETWRLVPRAAATVTTNERHAGAVQRRTGTCPTRIPVAPDVPDAGEASRALTRQRWGVPADADVVTFLGLVHPVKGVRHLVQALAQLRWAGRDVHLVVAGGFMSRALPEAHARSFREELAAWTRTCGVAEHVTVTGQLPAGEISAVLHASDIAAFPFIGGATTKSGALLTAFAHGLPTLVTQVDPAEGSGRGRTGGWPRAAAGR